MTQMKTSLLIVMAVFFTACRPMAYTYSKPSGISTFVECVREGEDTTVKVAISPVEDGASCHAEFDDGTPENLQISATNGACHISWKVGKNHIKKLSIDPYSFQLTIPSGKYPISVSFKTTSQQIISAFIQVLGSIH